MSISAFVDDAFISVWLQVKKALRNEPASLRVVYAKGAPRFNHLRAHVHDVPTIIYCIAGVARIRSASECLNLTAGDVVVIVPGAWHAHEPAQSGYILYGQGVSGLHSDILIQADGTSWSLLLPIEPSRMTLFSIISSQCDRDQILHVKNLFSHCGSGLANPTTIGAEIRNMANYLWRNLDRQITARDVLLSSGVGVRQAHRIFVGHYKTTPKKRILSAHLALARQYLNEGFSIGEAAAASGFANRFDLSRAWKRAHGLSPRNQYKHISPNGTL